MSPLHHLHPTASNHLTVVILTSPELVGAQNSSNCNFVYLDGGVVVVLGLKITFHQQLRSHVDVTSV